LKAGGAFRAPFMQPAQDQLPAAIVVINPGMQSLRHAVWRDAEHGTPLMPPAQDQLPAAIAVINPGRQSEARRRAAPVARTSCSRRRTSFPQRLL
jgi:hypothetical protein